MFEEAARAGDSALRPIRMGILHQQAGDEERPMTVVPDGPLTPETPVIGGQVLAGVQQQVRRRRSNATPCSAWGHQAPSRQRHHSAAAGSGLR